MLRRRLLVWMDSGKVNIAPPVTEAKWFKLVGVPSDNATKRYPNGDNVQRGRAVVAARRVARPLADPAFLQIVERLQPAADREAESAGSSWKRGVPPISPRPTCRPRG